MWELLTGELLYKDDDEVTLQPGSARECPIA